MKCAIFWVRLLCISAIIEDRDMRFTRPCVTFCETSITTNINIPTAFLSEVQGENENDQCWRCYNISDPI